MLHSRHIVVIDFPDGKTATVYNGPDHAAAIEARDAAVKESEAEAVIIFSHPQISQVRYPLQEKEDIKRRAEENELAKTQQARTAKAEAETLLKEAREKQAAAKKLLADLGI